jgi:hypothetical protein
MVREDGEQVHLVISSWVMKAFRAEISVDRPFFSKGLLSAEVENALQHYIVRLRNNRRSKQHSATDMQTARLEQDIKELKEGIITFMVSEGYWDDYSTTTQTIIKKHLREAILYVRNIKDNRQVNIWIRRLYDAGLLEGVGRDLYKFCNNDDDEPKIMDTSLDKASQSKVNEQPTTIVK